jgi:hypothetical protein
MRKTNRQRKKGRHQRNALVYREGDMVALNLDDTPTMYLRPDFARRLAAAIARHADDADACPLARSERAAMEHIYDDE